MAPKSGRLRGLLTLFVGAILLVGFISCSSTMMAERAGISNHYGPLTKTSRLESGILKHSGRLTR